MHFVAAAALAVGIGVLAWFPGVFAPETGGTFTVVAPAKHPLRTVVYAAGARARPHVTARQRSTRGSSAPAAGGTVAVASHQNARPPRTQGAITGRPSRAAQPRTLAGEPGPVNEKADIQSFQRRDDVGDAPPSQARRRAPSPKADATQPRPPQTPFRRSDGTGETP